MLANIKRLLLDNLVAKEGVWSHLRGISTRCVTLGLFVESLASSALACFLFLNYEISLTITGYAAILFD